MQMPWSGAPRGAWLVALTVVAVATGCSGSSGSEERVIFSEGRTLHLARFDSGLVEIDLAQIPGDGLLEGHTIFSVMKHPTKPWLYVSSFNECQNDSDWCWGNARIDRFVAQKDRFTYAGLAFKYDASATLATCASEDWGYVGQVGACAPVNGVFSANGSRLYVQEDDNDVLDVFEVRSDGGLTLLSEGGDLDQHGMAMDPSGVSTYLYNGSNVLTVGGDAGVNVTYGSGGNDTTFLHAQPTDLLLTTDGTSGVAIYSLANPAAPAVVGAALGIGSNRSRAVAVTPARDRLVAVGRDTVATVAFDGAGLTLEDTFDPSNGTTVVIENRNVALFDGGRRAAVAWFTASSNPSAVSGGVAVYGIGAAGEISTLANVALSRSSRALTVLELE